MKKRLSSVLTRCYTYLCGSPCSEVFVIRTTVALFQTEHAPAPRFKQTLPDASSQSAPDFQKQTTSRWPMRRVSMDGAALWLVKRYFRKWTTKPTKPEKGDNSWRSARLFLRSECTLLSQFKRVFRVTSFSTWQVLFLTASVCRELLFYRLLFRLHGTMGPVN